MKHLLAGVVLIVPALCLAAPPQCASWPINMAIVHLKNANITDPTKIDESKTRAVRLASEKIGRDLYRQVYDITFHEKAGREIEVVTSNESSSSECSMSGVDVYVVSQKIGGS
ncbi:hypothetical protein [Paraburkholderia diazotrophica]|uniref:hypothetical protein n=1 Tax=Paraburkholderia diazotrophica TaxID=667676 RepID=UPI00317E1AEF